MIRGGFGDAEPETHCGVTKRRLVLDGVTATRVSYAPGARWSIDMAPRAGTPTCAHPQVAVVVEGTLRARMDDGSEQDFTVGEVTLLPGGHDAWPDGGGGCAFVELSHGTVEHLG
jgi:quercetin dioxygenase-like cupin family protein